MPSESEPDLTHISNQILARADKRRDNIIAFEMVRTRLGVRSWADVGRATGLGRARIYALVYGADLRAEERALIEAAIREHNHARNGRSKVAP